MLTIEIFWNDLTKEKQDEITELLNGADHNWFFPMATIEIEEDDE